MKYLLTLEKKLIFTICPKIRINRKILQDNIFDKLKTNTQR